MRAHPQIAIDGAAGTGKSTIGARLAARLGYLYVDTGAFYRALTFVALDRDISPDDADALSDLAAHVAIIITAPTLADGRQYTVLVDGDDVTTRLRTPAVDAAVSQVSSPPLVRAAMRQRQRETADNQSVVMVGRDIGAVVLPEADLKILLETSLDERARRRHADLVATYGVRAPSLDTVRHEIAQRDASDAANMPIPPDVVRINNDALTADDVVARIFDLLAERRASRA
ncbi:MAG: Cytidylate kinase [Ktedonobacterales bacterium]|jgi:cytidylate kinase|nr:MAG: Cytidylate kinase [Ktedonobacterales bacterium]